MDIGIIILSNSVCDQFMAADSFQNQNWEKQHGEDSVRGAKNFFSASRFSWQSWF